MDTGNTQSQVEQPVRESGKQIHRRESLRQIYLPFLGALLLIGGLVLVVGLQSEPVWRARTQAISDFMYTLLCLIPLIVCQFPLYVLVLFGIFGVNMLHRGTERPLRKLEQRAGVIADWIEVRSNLIREKTVSYSEQIAPIMRKMDVFEQDDTGTIREKEQHESVKD